MLVALVFVKSLPQPAGTSQPFTTSPEPMDARIRLKELPGKRYAVIRYSGFWSDANYQTHLEKLEQATQAVGVATQRYGRPWSPALRLSHKAAALQIRARDADRVGVSNMGASPAFGVAQASARRATWRVAIFGSHCAS